MSPRAPSRSRTVMTQLVFPEHANALGKAFGGQVMAWTDMCGGICAMRHVGGLAVTAAIDDLVFDRPLAVGDMVVLEARVNAAFRTSLEVEVGVWGETPATGARWKCVTALFTFVGVDEKGALRPVPALLPETDEDRARVEDATRRRAERLQRRKAPRA